MDTNLANIVKQIIAEQGETVLENPQRMKAFFADLAKEEPKPLRLAFGRCIEAGAYPALKNAQDAEERREVKAALAQRVHDEEGVDIVFCGSALDVLEAALFGEVKNKARCRQCGKEIQPDWALCPFCGAQISAVPAALQPASPSLQMAPPYQARQPRQEARKRSKLLLAALIWQLLAVVVAVVVVVVAVVEGAVAVVEGAVAVVEGAAAVGVVGVGVGVVTPKVKGVGRVIAGVMLLLLLLLVVVVLSEGEVSVLVLVGLGAGAGGALIFTIQGWQKNNWKKIKISLPLYFPQVLFALLVLLWNWNFFTVSDFLPFILFVLLAGGPAILCVIALARKKKKRT